MTFEIPFDKEITTAQYTLRLNQTFKRNLSKAGFIVFCAGIMLLLAWLEVRGKMTLGYFLLSLGLFYLFNSLHYFSYYLKSSRKLKKVYRDMVNLREAHNDTTTWRFEPDAFGYKDMYYDYRIVWEAFYGYKVVEGNLFLQAKEGVDQSFIIGEVEIGEEPFAEVLAFVGDRLKNVGYQMT